MALASDYTAAAVGADASPARRAAPCFLATWRDGAHDPAWNMAADEALAEWSAATGRSALRLYDWDRPACSFGYFQPASVALPGLAAVRRPTGGGLVDHRQDCTFTLALPAAHPLARENRFESYRRINGAIAQALLAAGWPVTLTEVEQPPPDRRLLHCFRHPARFDVLLAGRKVLGGAQRRTSTYLLHQGSLQLGPLSEPQRTAERERLVQILGELVAPSVTEFALSPTLRERIGRLAHDKYAATEWHERR